jgi:glycine betaine/proline transport system substrate-binding protein
MTDPPAPGAIVLGRIDESFHQVAAAVVEEVLVRLGHEVEVREGPHPQMYPLLACGELQLFADSWLPGGHGTYWEQIRDRVVEVAPLFDGRGSSGPCRATSRPTWCRPYPT